MRGFFAIVALIVAIGGMLVVIGYGASSAYLNMGDGEADLYDSMLMGSIAPSNLTAAEMVDVSYREQFITPCLQTPLLEGVGLNGRGAANYGGGPAVAGSIQAMLLQTSEANARAIMDDVGRDTENNCQRGTTVGTVESATVETLDVPTVDRAIVVTTVRQSGDDTLRQSTVMFRNGEYIARLHQDSPGASGSTDTLITDLAVSLAGQVDDPPTAAELEAAGALDEPTLIEEFAERTRTETSRLLTAFDRVPVGAGLGMLGGAILLFYFFGARLSKSPDVEPASSPSVAAPLSTATLSNYGTKSRKPVEALPASTAIDEEPSPEGDQPGSELAVDSDESNGHREADLAEPPPSILNFPQKPIDEKLKILKEARLKEPKREHKAVREMRSDVNWTDEISSEDSKEQVESAVSQPGQVSRKALLKKLRSSQAEEG